MAKQISELEIITAKIVKLAKKLKKMPQDITKLDIVSSGMVKEWEIRKLGGVAAIVSTIKSDKDPHVLADFTKESMGSILKENDYQDGTFFITAASPTSYLDWSPADHARAKLGDDVLAENLFEPGFKAVQNFLKRKKAELVILPMPAHVKALQKQPLHYDPKLQAHFGSFATEFTFNKHLKAIEAYLNPQQTNPLTGLKRLRIFRYDDLNGKGQEIKRFKTSIIVGHTKQMMEVVPTGNDSTPRIIHSTGTITKPGYLRNRIGMIANEDHKLGGLIVEIQGDVFWLRQAQFDPKDGSFVDVGIRYHADGTIATERAEAFKMGDLHSGHEHVEAIDQMFKLWEQIKPKRIFLEDGFSSDSISHHVENKRLTKAKMPSVFKDLPTEIAHAKKVLQNIWDNAPKDAEIVMVDANHNDHVMQYLDRGSYLRDCKENYEIGHRMVVMALDGKNPLQEYLDPNKRMVWGNGNKDYFVEGVQMAAHGHLGIGGARGSKMSHETAYGNAMTAHTHQPSVYHDAYTVGHMSHDRHGYNRGPQNWLVCSGAVYKGGQKQLYIFVKGKFQKGDGSAKKIGVVKRSTKKK